MKKNLFSLTELKSVVPKVTEDLKALHEKFSPHMCAGEAANFVAQYILLWLQGGRRLRLIGDYRHPTRSVDFIPSQYEYLWTLSRNRLQHVSHHINSVLIDWSAEDFHLQLEDRELEPTEVLHLQTKGQRCVTCLFPPNDLTSYTHDRDPLSFCLHDLMHAFHFYSDKSLLAPQVGFARFIHALTQKNMFHPLKEAPQFQAKLEYAYSDMNAHPIHLLKYFRAIVDEAQEHLGFQEDFWNPLAEASDIPEAVRDGFFSLNRPTENTNGFVQLTKWLAEKGSL